MGTKTAKVDAASATRALSIAEHPRAVRRIAQARSWAGLVGFLLGGYLSLSTQTFVGAGLRALEAGVVCYVVVWGVAVFLWRVLAVAELRNAEHELLAAELAKLAPAQSSDPAGAPAPRAGERALAGR